LVEELTDFGAIETRPKMEGPNLIAIFAPKAASGATAKAAKVPKVPKALKAPKANETKNP
jgi:hypothetical protein